MGGGHARRTRAVRRHPAAGTGAGWGVGPGTTKSLYGRDPDGLEFEIAWIVPADLLDDDAVAARERIGPLDLKREMARYGAETRGGIGISEPATA